MNLKLKAVLESVLFAAVSAVLLVILSFIPVLNVVILIWPVPFIILGVRREPWVGVLGLIVAGLLLGVVFHPFVGFAVVLFNLPLVMVLAWSTKKRFDLFEYIVMSAGAVLLSIVTFMQAFSWFTGQTVFEYMINGIRKLVSSNVLDFRSMIDLYAQLKIIEKPMSAGEFAEVIIGQIEQIMPLFPSMLIVFSLTYGTVNLLVSRMALKKMGYVLSGLPKFSEWMLPKGAGLGFMAMLFIAYVGNLLNVKNFEVVFYTVLSLCSFVFSIQGLAVAMFFMKHKMGKVAPFFRAVLLVLLFMIVPRLLMSIGILEQIFKLRAVYKRMN